MIGSPPKQKKPHRIFFLIANEQKQMKRTGGVKPKTDVNCLPPGTQSTYLRLLRMTRDTVCSLYVKPKISQTEDDCLIY
jgi:hypothetical protein